MLVRLTWDVQITLVFFFSHFFLLFPLSPSISPIFCILILYVSLLSLSLNSDARLWMKASMGRAVRANSTEVARGGASCSIDSELNPLHHHLRFVYGVIVVEEPHFLEIVVFVSTKREPLHFQVLRLQGKEEKNEKTWDNLYTRVVWTFISPTNISYHFY